MKKKYRGERIIFALMLTAVLFLLTSCSVIGEISAEINGVQRPQVKYGEFPFKLVYRIQDEIVTVEDTVVCEYKGVKWTLDAGAFRTWDSYIKGTGRWNVLATRDNDEEIVITVGSYGYYMMTSSHYGDDPYTPSIQKHGPRGMSIQSEKIAEEYDIEIISFEYTEPIAALMYEDDCYDMDAW